MDELYLRYRNDFPDDTPTMSYNRMLTYYENMLKNEENKEVTSMFRNIKLLRDTLNSVIRKEYLKQRVLELAARVQPAQRTPGWYALRKSMFTASSDIGNITGTSYDHKAATSQRAIQHIEDLLILKKNGNDLKAFKGNQATRWGNMLEEVVTQLYSNKNTTTVLEFGLMQHDEYPFIGASPDGITPNGMMLEIKCPMHRRITGVVPGYYWTQMQVQLAAADLEECDFVECKFKRYASDSACVRDKYADANGVLGEYYKCNCNHDTCNCHKDPDNRHYCYPPLGPMDQQKDFIRSYKTEQKFLGFVYWGLMQYSCVRVQRDRIWFDEQLPKIRAAWEKVIYYRENPSELNKVLLRAQDYEHEKTVGSTQTLIGCMTSSSEDSN